MNIIRSLKEANSKTVIPIWVHVVMSLSLFLPMRFEWPVEKITWEIIFRIAFAVFTVFYTVCILIFGDGKYKMSWKEMILSFTLFLSAVIKVSI